MRTLSVWLVVGAVAAFAVPAVADSVELFGQTYEVQRFDYFMEIEFPNPDPEQEPVWPIVNMMEIEGARYIGDNRLLLASEKMSVVTYKTICVEAELVTDAQTGQITGLEFVRLVFWQDPPIPPDPGYDLSPSGLAINTGETGLGAGGNLVVSDTENQIVHGYDFETGEPIPWWDPPLDPNDPLHDGWSVLPEAYEPEDVVYVPERDQFYLVQEDDVGTYGGFRLVVFDPDGTYDAEGSWDTPSPAGGKPKGLAYMPDVDALPAMFHGAGGALLLTWDDEGPALDVYDLDGNLLAYEPLDAEVQQILDPGQQTIAIESCAVDPETGRLFLVQQGDVTLDNYLFVLTPLVVGDMDCDGDVDFDDIAPFVLALGGEAGYQAGYPHCRWLNADANGDGTVTFDDIAPFVTLIGG